MEAFQAAMTGHQLPSSGIQQKQQQQQQQLLSRGSMGCLSDLMDVSPTSSPTTQQAFAAADAAYTPSSPASGGHSAAGASTHDGIADGDVDEAMLMLLDRPDVAGCSGLSTSSMQLKQGAAGTAHDSSPTSTHQPQRGQPQLGEQRAPQQDLFNELMLQQQSYLQRVQAVSDQLQHQHDGDEDTASPGCSVAIIAPAGAFSKPQLPMKPPVVAAGGGGSAAVGELVSKAAPLSALPPAALARGFGSFFLAAPEEAAAGGGGTGRAGGAAASASAAVRDRATGVAASAAQPKQQQQQRVLPPTSAGAGSGAADSKQQQHDGDFTDLMVDLLDTVVDQFNTQRVSSPSVDGAPAPAKPTPAVSDSCSPNNPTRSLPSGKAGAAAGALAAAAAATAGGGNSSSTARCKHTEELDRELLGDVAGDVDLADLFDEDSTDPDDEHNMMLTGVGTAAATATATAVAGGRTPGQQPGVMTQHNAAGVQVQQSALMMQQHHVALSGLQCLTPRGVISRPTVTTGTMHSSQHGTFNSTAGGGSTVSSWQQQQQVSIEKTPQSGSSSGRMQSGGGTGTGVVSSSTCTDDPAVTGNTEEDEMLQQVLPQLTAAMEREAAAAESESRGTGGTTGATVDSRMRQQHHDDMQHVPAPMLHNSSSRAGPLAGGPHSMQQYSTHNVQQQHEVQQTGSPFASRNTQQALRSSLDMPGFNNNSQLLLPPEPQFGRHSLSGPPPVSLRHSGSGSMLHADPMMAQQQQQQQQQMGPHPGLPRYPSHPGSMHYQQQQQQQQQQQRVMMMPQQLQQQGVTPAGWGPPAPAGFLQPPRSHYSAGGQQQQQYGNSQHQQLPPQHNNMLQRVQSAPAMPHPMGPGAGGRVGGGSSGGGGGPPPAGGSYPPNVAWGPPGPAQPHMLPPPYMQGSYSSAAGGHLARTSSGGNMPPLGSTWPGSGGSGLPPSGPGPAGAGAVGGGRSSQDHHLGFSSRHSQDHLVEYSSRHSQDHLGAPTGFYQPPGSYSGPPMPAGGGMPPVGRVSDGSLQRQSSHGAGGVGGGRTSGGGGGGSMSSMMVPQGRTISSLNMAYPGVPVTTGRSAQGGPDPAAAAAAAGPPVKTGTGRPRGRPRKHPLPGAPAAAAAAAPVEHLPAAYQQQQQYYNDGQQQQEHWHAGYNNLEHSGSGNLLVLQRKRSSSFTGLEDPAGLKYKVQRSEGGPSSAGMPGVLSGSGGSGGISRAPPPALPKPQKKPKAVTKPTVNKDGVLVPPPAGPDMAARGWPPFSDLVVAGTFPPGTYDFSCGTVPSVIATVTPNGLIRWNDETYQSISSFALSVVRTFKPTRQACDGWRECRLKGVKIHEWRAAFLEKRAPPAVPPEAIVKQ